MKRSEHLGKLLFWILTAVFLLTLTLTGYWMFPYIWDVFSEDRGWFVFMGLAMLLLITLNGAIAIFIHRDASRMGMSTWLWMTAVIYIPNFIGLLIYLLVRQQHRRYGGVGSKEEYCPHCGHMIRAGEGTE